MVGSWVFMPCVFQIGTISKEYLIAKNGIFLMKSVRTALVMFCSVLFCFVFSIPMLTLDNLLKKKWKNASKPLAFKVNAQNKGK